MLRRSAAFAAALILALWLEGEALAVGKYCLAFWREVGFNEKGGIGGTHMINVHVWDASGNPCIGKHIYTSSLDLGETDQRGQLEIPIYMPNAYPLRVVDGSNLSDVTPGFSSTRAPDWGHYSFECGFVYVPDSASAPAFNLLYDGIFNSSSSNYVCNNYQMSAPRTRSVAFYSTRPDAGYYCSDGIEGGSAAASVGQTFKATGDRVVACKFSPVGTTAQYIARIRQGGPTGAYVGTAALSHAFGEYEFSKTLIYWGLNAVPVVPGNTYFLEITKLGGGNLTAYRVVNNNDGNGCYYEGTTPNTAKELRGQVVCATAGTLPGTGTISGWVKDTGGNPISGATVSTNVGGYTTTTNDSGNYTLTYVAVGTYNVTATRTGYVSSVNSGVVANDGQTTSSNFTLQRNAGTIAGYVRDTSGSPVSGATVSTGTGGYTATSGGTGYYALTNVDVGTYDVTASKVGYQPQTQTGKVVLFNQTTTADFNLSAGAELLTNGGFTNGCTGWSHTESPSGIYWGCGNKAYPGNTPGSGGHSWNAYLSCGGYWCDRPFTGSQQQDNVTVYAGVAYQASAQVYYEPVKYPGVPGDQKERLVLSFNNGTTHTSSWRTHVTSDGWDQITLSGTVPSGATKVSFRVELSHVDGQWSGTGAVDECSLVSQNAGVLAGYVRNSLGASIVGASVSTSPGSYSGATNAGGDYVINNVPPTTYDVTASASGYNSNTQTGKSVSVGATTTVNFTLTDASAPTTPTVTDDGAYTTGTASLHAAWSASDAQTGIVEYQYSIGTSPGASDVLGWTSVGTATEVTKDGLSLNHTSPYYFSVKARNGENMWSAVGSSNGIRSARALATIAEAKTYADGECVRVSGKLVSATFGDHFYIQDALRGVGIKVTGGMASEGVSVTVTGVMATVDAERVITSAQVE